MARIDSTEKWNNTGIRLVAGRTYKYEATGRWKDWYIECDANGYTNALMSIAGLLRRVPSAKWFQLIGVVDRNMTFLLKLGTSGRFTATRGGALWAFANDASMAYWNNSGSVELHIEEI